MIIFLVVVSFLIFSPPSLPPSFLPPSLPSLPLSHPPHPPSLPPSLHSPLSLTPSHSLPSLPPTPTHSLFVIFPARAPSNMTLTPEHMALGIEPGEDRHAGTQAGYQLALLGATLCVSIFGGLLTGTYHVVV